VKKRFKIAFHFVFLVILSGIVLFSHIALVTTQGARDDRYLIKRGSWSWSRSAEKPNTAYINNLDLVTDRGYISYRGEGGLEILDVSEPVKPVSLGSFYDGDISEGVAVYGNYAYLYGNSQMDILDVTDATNIEKVGVINGMGPVSSAVINNNLLYVWHNNQTTKNELDIFNISNPTSPEWVNELNFTGCPFHVRLAVNDEFLFMMIINGNLLVTSIEDVGSTFVSYPVLGLQDGFLVEDLLMVRQTSGFSIYNISELSPDLIGSYESRNVADGDIAVTDSYVFLTDYTSMEIVDISAPTMPTLVGFYEKGGRSPDEMMVVDEFVYLAFNDINSPEILILELQSKSPWLIPVISTAVGVIGVGTGIGLFFWLRKRNLSNS